MKFQDASYRIVAGHSGRGLAVWRMSFENGAPLQQMERIAGNANQMFRVEAVEPGFYRIVALHSGKCLETRGASTENCAPIQQAEFHGGEHQVFRLSEHADGEFRIWAKHSGKCLDVDGMSTANGATVQQFEPIEGGKNQLFTFKLALSPEQVRLAKALSSALSQLGPGSALVELLRGCGLDKVPWAMETLASRTTLPMLSAGLDAIATAASSVHCLQAVEAIAKVINGRRHGTPSARE